MINNIKQLENLYFQAKIEYYEGNPIMSDAEFDSLEKMLVNAGSKVKEQVGYKRKDFDFYHPTRMLSLSKLQSEKNQDGTINRMYNEFYTWFEKRSRIVGKMAILESSPKFDGSAINIVYKNGKLDSILTRGDGDKGKNITKRLKNSVPNFIGYISSSNGATTYDNSTVEIRCEVVIKLKTFKEKYEKDFANARNFVAGVLGKDDIDNEKINDLSIIPLHFIINGVHRNMDHEMFNDYPNIQSHWKKEFVFEDYEDIVKFWENERNSFPFQLDGVVISFPPIVRADLGENDHDPEWAIAIKFIPEETLTSVVGLEWNVSKRGEVNPVVLLNPVQLAGTIVKRASGYNAGYIIDNKVWQNALVTIAKAGDIIPEIQRVVSPSEDVYSLPEVCPECGTLLKYEKPYLICENETCSGKISKILTTGAAILDLKGVGGERLKPFAKDFMNIYEVWKWILEHQNCNYPYINKYGITYGSRLHQIFEESFTNIKSISYEKVIQILGYENVGKKISIQLAKEHCGLEPDWTGLERALVDKLHSKDVDSYIKTVISELESFGITIDRPKGPKDDSLIGVCLTGSPKEFGYKTKAEFLAKFPNLYECDLKDATYLVTDSMNSTSSKMKQADKKGIKIKTYGDF